MNDLVHKKSVENGVSEAERELSQAREHFKETLQDASEASQAVVRRVWQSGKPVLLGVAIFAGITWLVASRRSRTRSALVEIRLASPRASLQRSVLQLGAKLALAALVRRLSEEASLRGDGRAIVAVQVTPPPQSGI